jgi:hypothetical protein
VEKPCWLENGTTLFFVYAIYLLVVHTRFYEPWTLAHRN